MVITLIVTVLLVILMVLVHSQALLWLSRLMSRMRASARWKIIAGVTGAIFTHLFEVWLFAVGYFLLIAGGNAGQLTGDFSHGLRDCTYYSMIVYSSLGFGDILPTGPIRFLSGAEVLTGLLLMAWTASFLYLQMQRHWGKELGA